MIDARLKTVLKQFDGTTMLITGATGLIGKKLIGILNEWNAAGGSVRIAAVIRNKGKAEKLFGTERDSLRFFVGDIGTVDLSGLHAEYIVHAASETSSAAFVGSPVDSINVALDGTRHLLEYARGQELKRFLYTSTMEVYGSPGTDEKIFEDHGTNLNTMKVRSCYPESKRLCECLCASYCAQFGVPVSVLRLTQTFGPGVVYDDGRVFAEFARCVIEGRDIVLKTKGETRRSYLHVYDAASAILFALLYGKDAEAYNVANEKTYCSIFEMAQIVAKTFGRGKTRVVIEEQDITKFGYAPTLRMNLDTTKLRALGWNPINTLAETFRDLIEDMRKNEEGEKSR